MLARSRPETLVWYGAVPDAYVEAITGANVQEVSGDQWRAVVEALRNVQPSPP